MAQLTDGEAAIWRQLFDFWRQSYEHMPYVAHQLFYNMVARTFPDQDKADRDAVESALVHASVMHGHALKIWELGGWDGALARDMIERFGDGITEWRNIEICTREIEAGWRDDKAVYLPTSPPRWIWECAVFPLRGYDIAILSHVIEHLSWEHLIDLFNMLRDVPMLYIQTPASMGEEPHPTGWMGTMSTHKLEVGWSAVAELLHDLGYSKIWYKDQCQLWVKKKA